MLRRYPVGFRRNGPDLIEARTPAGRDRQPAETGVQLSPSDAATRGFPGQVRLNGLRLDDGGGPLRHRRPSPSCQSAPTPYPQGLGPPAAPIRRLYV